MKELRRYIHEVIKESLSSQDFIDTYNTAQRVHLDYNRRSGEPYFEHPKAVRNLVTKYYPKDRVAQLAALLHDTLEDYHKGSGYSSRQEVVEAILSSIRSKSLAQKVLAVVESLTHETGSYDEYLVSLSGDRTAMRVKLADMLHNSKSSPSERQLEKYSNAFSKLMAHFDGDIPGINPNHVQDLLSYLG